MINDSFMSTSEFQLENVGKYWNTWNYVPWFEVV